jgi:peptidase M23-like protein
MSQVRRGSVVPLFVVGLLLVLVPQAGAAITQPGGNGVAKDRGFTITPPWGCGKAFRMTCGYGCGRHDNIGTQDYFALDFPMPAGEPIYPVAPGKVLLAEALGGGWEPYGNAVFIQHQNGYRSFYAHLQSIAVAAGDQVDVDTPIGGAGQSGSGASSDHLHFVLYKDAVVGGGGFGNRGPSGGSAVVPEPFSGCTGENGGDCEGIIIGNLLRRDDFAPAAIVHPDRSLDLFTCGRTSRNLVHRYRTAAGAWQGWENLDGVCASSPMAVRDAAGRVYVFVRGLDGRLYYKRRDAVGGAWNGWFWLDATVVGRGAAALDTVSGVVRVFARRAPDDALYYASQSGLGFGGWIRLGGTVVNSPVARTRGDGRVDAFVAGLDSTFWKMPALVDGSFAAENWISQGVQIEGTPDLVADGVLEWLVRSTGDQLLRQPGGVVSTATHPPAGARNLSGLLYVFRRNRTTSAADYFYENIGGSWSGNSFGGLVTSELEAVRAGTGDRILMFTWGTGGLYLREQSFANANTSWGDWVDLQVPN